MAPEDCKPGDWVATSSNGGPVHMEVQYAKAIDFLVIGVDIADDKLELARKLGADTVVNAATRVAAAKVQKHVSGMHRVLVSSRAGSGRAAFARW